MVETVQDGVTSFPPLSLQVTRLSLGFVLDTVQISRAGGDLLEPLLLTAILEANLAPLNQDPALQLAYAGLDTAAPDDLRRPVSVNAIAQSLRLPFETVRRRVRGLAQRGVCTITAQGVFVPHSVVTSPSYNALQVARHDRLRQFYDALKEAGAFSEIFEPPRAPAATAWPVRVVNRVLSEYMLRASDLMMGLTGDALSSVVLLEMARANTRHIVDGQASVPEDLQAVSATRLSVALGLPAETTRRHVVILEAAGFCRRTPAGLVVAATPAMLAEVARIVEANLANLERMFTRLRQLDVLAIWDAGAHAPRSHAVG